jgi:outer membrane protein assembly factor BamB
MPNTGDINATYCPSCGASIEMQGNQGSCIYCGTVVERQASSAASSNQRFTVTQAKLVPPPASQPQPTSPYSPIDPASDGRRRASCMLGLVMSIVFIVVGVAIGLVVARQPVRVALPGVSIPDGPVAVVEPMATPARAIETDEPPVAEIGDINKMLASLPRDGAGADLLAFINNPNNQGLSLMRIDGGSRTVSWRSQPLSKDVHQGLLVVDVDMAYLTDQEKLVAIRLSDGSVAWQADLVAEPVGACADCLRLVKDHVVVLQKDGSLQGFDTGSGQRSWSISLNDPPRQLPVVDGQLLLFQSAEQNRKLISLIDPATGKETRSFEPTCERESPPGEEQIDSYSTLLFEPDGKTMYALYGFFSHCAQRWDLTSGKLVWETVFEMDLPMRWDEDERPLLVGDTIFFNNDSSTDGGLWALDTSNGEVRTVITKPKYRFVPVAARDNIVIVLTWPTWDTEKQSLVGLDVASGEQRWEFKPQVGGARISTTHGGWDWRMTKQGLLSIQVLEEQQQLVTEILDPQTGTSAKQQVTPLDASGSLVFWNALWGDEMAWLDIGRFVYVIDLETGTTAYRMD